MPDSGQTLRFHNSGARAKDDFAPLDPSNIRMYVCGPTVYDYAHIGNARPVIVFDLLYRLLKHLAAHNHWEAHGGKARVTYVRNITDVDDKINARAARDYPGVPLNEAIRAVTEKTARQFHLDVAELGCLAPDIEPRATSHIQDMIDLTARLIANGHAYAADGHVLFAVTSWKDADGASEYGRLARRSLDDMIAGARVEVAPYKHNPMDFVLWKPSSPEDPGWESPWGRGRPGWHIECSAMADRWLWEEAKPALSAAGLANPHQFDIHGGGIDLTFPHHENELAQSCCGFGTTRMASVWLHNGFLQVEGRKMAKSEGNFVTIRELLSTDTFAGRSWSGEVLRLAMLMTHYREPIDFSIRKLEEAENILHKWREQIGAASVASLWREPSPEVVAALMDDLNSPAASLAIHRLAEDSDSNALAAAMAFFGVLPTPLQKLANLGQQEALIEIAACHGGSVPDTLRTLMAMLAGADTGEIDRAIERRLAFIRDKNWAEADRIREELQSRQVRLKDGKDSVTGERITTWELSA
ncbi:cysteine--tRNA ligase [Mesorhizobium sp. Root554]|uniref:cysteine--tRNA ligase n=1 Tax=unclassified Mesorhizobium TaxID=325217 RepID=UPI0006F9D744|nr:MULTISPECIES: cysteine--tRNA ligase [unclassified Mesorhizobium]KQZ15130.1 cysteine--tRNA ligase [Mesorhizobium sp. Root1471]KQZ37638.1 cysteine--tRNA ligase [Mesorhizobium sp. Root554]